MDLIQYVSNASAWRCRDHAYRAGIREFKVCSCLWDLPANERVLEGARQDLTAGMDRLSFPDVLWEELSRDPARGTGRLSFTQSWMRGPWRFGEDLWQPRRFYESRVSAED